MHDVLRQRLLRKIESLPDEQIYQVLDYIEFLESKYAVAEAVEASGLQKFAEGLENKLRKRAVSPSTIREAFQLISAADRVLSGVSSAGKQILADLNQALEPTAEDGAPSVGAADRSPGPTQSGGAHEATAGTRPAESPSSEADADDAEGPDGVVGERDAGGP
jgi:hypothetical protein